MTILRNRISTVKEGTFNWNCKQINAITSIYLSFILMLFSRKYKHFGFFFPTILGAFPHQSSEDHKFCFGLKCTCFRPYISSSQALLRMLIFIHISLGPSELSSTATLPARYIIAYQFLVIMYFNSYIQTSLVSMQFLFEIL